MRILRLITNYTWLEISYIGVINIQLITLLNDDIENDDNYNDLN
jgi:hypothetical protein